MRHELRVAVILAATSVTFTACVENTTPPTAPKTALVPISPSADLSVPTCDITTIKSFARDYAKSSRDALFTIIGDIQKSGAPNTDKAFDGLARVAAIRGTTDQKSGVTAAIFDGLVRGLLGCADAAVLTGTESLPAAGFGPAATAAGGWLFEVRGKNAAPPATGPYVAGPYDDPSGWAYQRGTTSPATWWAVGPSVTDNPAETRWTRSFGTTGSQAKRFLVYGYPEPTFLQGLPGVVSRFEIRTIPKISSTFEATVRVGLCFATLPTTTTQRLNHNNVFVPKTDIVCGSGPAAVNVASATFESLNPAVLAERALGFLTPQPAFAAFVTGGFGGGVKDLSPSAIYDLSALATPDSLGTIADGRVSSELKTTAPLSPYGTHVVVQVLTTASPTAKPVQGVPIEMSIAGNSSSIAFFNTGTGPDSVTVTRTTDARGFADFGGVRLTKAGGYQLAFRVAFDQIFGTPRLSNSFNFQNK